DDSAEPSDHRTLGPSDRRVVDARALRPPGRRAAGLSGRPAVGPSGRRAVGAPYPPAVRPSLSAVLAGSGVGAGELRVVDRFEPGDLLALFVVLLGGEMGHERVLARTVPVLLQRRDPHRLTGLDRQHRAIAADDQSGAVG